MAAANRRWLKEILTYVCYTLLYAFFPIACLFLVRSVQGSSFNIPVLVADGGIFAIAIGLNAGAFGRLISNDTKWPEVKIVLAAFASLAMACGSFLYALRYVRGALDSALFVDLSFLVFIVSILIVLFCRLLPEDDR
jgi:hypothetical protein